jgi:hypothetical protein
MPTSDGRTMRRAVLAAALALVVLGALTRPESSTW